MTRLRQLAVGDVVLVDLPAHHPRGHEQEGRRPAVVVGLPKGPTRFPALAIAPITTAAGSWQSANPALYPALPAGDGGLRRVSHVLGDQVRVIDRRRMLGRLGTLPQGSRSLALAAVDTALGR